MFATMMLLGHACLAYVSFFGIRDLLRLRKNTIPRNGSFHYFSPMHITKPLHHSPELLDVFLQVVVYGPEQMGASEEEIAPNYYMGNGLGLLKVCRLIEFAATSIQDQAKHMGVNGYCRGGGKQRGACEYYDSKNHGGRACPAPKYESFHGFRNAVPPNIDKAFKAWDMRFMQEHSQDVSRVKVVGGDSDSSSRHTASLTVKEAPTDLEMSLKTLDKAISPKS